MSSTGRQHNAHIVARIDWALAQVEALLFPPCEAGWADWAHYAAAGEW